MTQRKPKDWREARRLRAWELKQQGWKQSKIAEALGVTAGAVSQWVKAAREGGVEALYGTTGGGPKRKLAVEQREALPDLLARGAQAHGFRGDVWTCPRVAQVIKREFGVQYTPQHVGTVLRQIGWSRQKPVQRASQRNEAAIEQWREDVWPELKKKHNGRNEPSSS